MAQFFVTAPIFIVIFAFCIALLILTKSADILTDQAILFSKKIGISDLIIGATIVSLGTSLPEFATSVLALFHDGTELALGNALGSVVTNLSFILGIAILYGTIPVTKKAAYNVWFAFAGLLTLYICILIQHQEIPRWLGFLFLCLLVVYLYQSFNKEKKGAESLAQGVKQQPITTSTSLLVLKVLLSAVAVALSSSVLVATVQGTAQRFGVSEGIISATIVALGTSLPELSTVISAGKKGHGGLAFGNLVGASLMNVFFVLGTTIAFSKNAIQVPLAFCQFHFPLALFLFGYLLYCIYSSKKSKLSRKEGIFFLILYGIYLLYNLLQ